MARRPRISVRGGLHHVTARGNRKQPIFVQDWDKRHFLTLLEEAGKRFQWRCFAYCLMPNHYHLVIKQHDSGLSAGIQYLNGIYAQWFNRRYELSGHLFQGRFHSVLVESDWHLLELARYLAMNPVRAGLCSRPAEWAWSSYGPVAGSAPVPAFLDVDDVLQYFGSDVDKAREAFVAFVRDVGSFVPTWPS